MRKLDPNTPPAGEISQAAMLISWIMDPRLITPIGTFTNLGIHHDLGVWIMDHYLHPLKNTPKRTDDEPDLDNCNRLSTNQRSQIMSILWGNKT